MTSELGYQARGGRRKAGMERDEERTVVYPKSLDNFGVEADAVGQARGVAKGEDIPVGAYGVKANVEVRRQLADNLGDCVLAPCNVSFILVDIDGEGGEARGHGESIDGSRSHAERSEKRKCVTWTCLSEGEARSFWPGVGVFSGACSG